MFNDTLSDSKKHKQPNCVFYNKNTHSCRYCQDKFIECLGEDACDMFYNAEQAKLFDPNTTPLAKIVKSLEVQHNQLQLLAQELQDSHNNLAQTQTDYAQLLADKNTIVN